MKDEIAPRIKATFQYARCTCHFIAETPFFAIGR
jgi:hypothetical protein